MVVVKDLINGRKHLLLILNVVRPFFKDCLLAIFDNICMERMGYEDVWEG